MKTLKRDIIFRKTLLELFTFFSQSMNMEAQAFLGLRGVHTYQHFMCRYAKVEFLYAVANTVIVELKKEQKTNISQQFEERIKQNPQISILKPRIHIKRG